MIADRILDPIVYCSVDLINFVIGATDISRQSGVKVHQRIKTLLQHILSFLSQCPKIKGNSYACLSAQELDPLGYIDSKVSDTLQVVDLQNGNDKRQVDSDQLVKRCGPERSTGNVIDL